MSPIVFGKDRDKKPQTKPKRIALSYTTERTTDRSGFRQMEPIVPKCRSEGEKFHK